MGDLHWDLASGVETQEAVKPTCGQKNDQAADPAKDQAAKLVTIELETGAE